MRSPWRARARVHFGYPTGGRTWRLIVGAAGLALVLQIVLVLVALGQQWRGPYVTPGAQRMAVDEQGPAQPPVHRDR